MRSQDTTGEYVLSGLYPKAAANYLSKLPGLQEVDYPTILATMLDTHESYASRVRRLADYAGGIALPREVNTELGILDLVMRGNESAVDDADRQAFYRIADQEQAQFRTDSRTREFYLNHGIEIQLDATLPEKLRGALAKDQRGEVPLFERVKAERLLTINGFNDSRVMYLLHDLLDHPWLFTELTKNGIFDKYRDFLDSIDLNDSTYLYSRQSELVAGIGYGSRRWPRARLENEASLLTVGHVARILESSQDTRSKDVHDRFLALPPDRQAGGLFVLENCIIQTADERRRFGAVKQLNIDTGERKPMDLTDPLYVTFVLDVAMALQSHPEYEPLQVATTMQVEAFLEEIAEGRLREGAHTMYLPSLSYQRPSLVKQKQVWIDDNYSALTSYNKVS